MRPSSSTLRSSLALLATLACALSAQARSGVPPTGRAGDPGAQTCVEGCHASFPVNSGDVTLELFDGATMLPITAYAPGGTYSLVIGITSGESGRGIWGFQAVPLDPSNAMAGSLSAGPGTATGVSGGRTYVHHSGAPADAMGASWTFTWNAPAMDVGDVTFYTCGNAGNRNFSASGDYIECPTFVLRPEAGPVDSDGDGLTDDVENMIGTNPNDPDTDGDMLLDGEEVNDTMTNPLLSDTDGDGLDDFEEVMGPTDPLDLDSDDDGLTDGDEVLTEGTDPASCDSDGDGIADGTELGVTLPVDDPDGAGPLLGTDEAASCAVPSGRAYTPDEDPATLTDPNSDDSDGDDCLDGEEDANGNGLFDMGETGDASIADCFAAGGGLMRIARTLDDPAIGAAHEVMGLDPCTPGGDDLVICSEYPGTVDDLLDPVWPVSVAGDGVLVFIEYDEDISTPGNADSIRVAKDPASPGDLIVSRP